MQVRYRGAESGGGKGESCVLAGGGVMVCDYQDLLIDLPEHPVSVDPEKIETICLSELEEELWMG